MTRKTLLIALGLMLLVGLTFGFATTASAAATYTITATAGANGSINPIGAKEVAAGGSVVYTMEPAEGYQVATITVDATAVPKACWYTFLNVTAPHTISVTFKPNPVGWFTVTPHAGEHGQIWMAQQTVQASDTAPVNVACSIIPDAGYHVATLVVDGQLVAPATYYIFYNVRAGHTISATFAADVAGPFTITASTGANGAISPSGAVSVASGATQAFTITASSGYHVADVSVDGASAGAVSAYTFTNVTANHTIAASFAANVVPNSSLTIRTSRTLAYIGQTFILSGLARPTPDMVGRNMHVDVKKPGKPYWAYSSARTIYVGPSGTAEWWYRYYLDPKKVASGLVRRGTYLFKAVYDGDGFLPCQSPTLSVLVR